MIPEVDISCILCVGIFSIAFSCLDFQPSLSSISVQISANLSFKTKRKHPQITTRPAQHMIDRDKSNTFFGTNAHPSKKKSTRCTEPHDACKGVSKSDAFQLRRESRGFVEEPRGFAEEPRGSAEESRGFAEEPRGSWGCSSQRFFASDYKIGI
jgi:hypothetical protein